MTKRLDRHKPVEGSTKQTPTPSREELGQKSYEQGHSFEKKVAELYRLLHYDVEHGRLFSGRQVDLILTGRLGDLTLCRAIECKVGPVNADHIDSFIAKLHLVRAEYPTVQGSIISAVSFTDAIKSQAHREGIQLTLYRDLAAQLLDGHSYAHSLCARDCEKHLSAIRWTSTSNPILVSMPPVIVPRRFSLSLNGSRQGIGTNLRFLETWAWEVILIENDCLSPSHIVFEGTAGKPPSCFDRPPKC